MKNSSLYDQDYLAWIEKTGQQLTDAKWDEIDLKNLIEEIQDLGKSQRQALLNNLTIILLHLLKYKYQPAHRRNSWLASIVEHRIRVENHIDDIPSLKPYLQEVFGKAYNNGRRRAAIETGLNLDIFPVECPFTVERTFNLDFLPE